MKKLFLIGLGFALAIAVFGVAGFAYAQTQKPPQATAGLGFPFDADEDEPGPLHDYLFPAIAEAFGLTDEQIEAFELVRQTVQDIRSDLTQEEIQETMQQAFSTAIENALSDGVITEDQAERWLERMEWMGDRLPGVFFPGRSSRGHAQSYRQGFATGFRFSRQMMLNHEYIDAAIADEIGISVEALQEMKADQGFNLRDYADEQGLSDDEFTAWRLEIFTNAVNAALEDGAITQEQADWILERLTNMEERGVWFAQP